MLPVVDLQVSCGEDVSDMAALCCTLCTRGNMKKSRQLLLKAFKKNSLFGSAAAPSPLVYMSTSSIPVHL